MNIVDRHRPREFSLLAMSHGIVLCDREDGAFIVLRFAEDVERLKSLLDTVEVTRLPSKRGE